MARYRKVDPRIWNDAKFRELSDNAKLLFFMLLSHPNMTALGAMRASLAGCAEELNWSIEDFREAFTEVLQKSMAEHDPKACLIALPNFIKYNQPESPNVIKAWAASLDLLPECDLKTRVVARAKDFAEGMSKAFAEALPESFAKSMPNQEQEQEQEQKQEPNAVAAVAAPIARSWWPSRATWDDLHFVHGYPPEWIDQQVPSFVAYWFDRNEARISFDALFIDHCLVRANLRIVS